MKRKLLTGLASLTLLDITAALAADLPPAMPVKAPVIAMAPSWTGFYVGAHAGGRWATADLNTSAYSATGFGSTIPIAAINTSLNSTGGIFGLHAGYNYQFDPKWLAGIEADLSWGKQSASIGNRYVSADGSTFVSRLSKLELTWQASIRGRLGVVNGPWLFYGTGGIAFLHTNWSDIWSPTSGVTTPTFSTSQGRTNVGWTAGGGIEYMLTSHWLLRGEYLFARYGSFDVPLGGFSVVPPTPTTTTGTISHLTTNTLRAAVSYRF